MSKKAAPRLSVADLQHKYGDRPVIEGLTFTLAAGQATALVRPRKLMVLDEPEARLDTGGVQWLSERLVAEKKSGTAILFASHDPALVETVADSVVTLTPLP